MDQRQLEKERIRLTREISMLETQLNAAIRGREEKLEENKQIREEIARLEEENKALEEETRKLDEEIASLDEEFKQAQIDAGRFRREIKVNNERAEAEADKTAGLRKEINSLQNNLEALRREIKHEIDERRNLEAKLRKTNAHIDSMKSHPMARFVTKNLEKQDWYQRMESPQYAGEGLPEAVSEEMKPDKTGAGIRVESGTESKKEGKSKDDGESGGIDFSID